MREPGKCYNQFKEKVKLVWIDREQGVRTTEQLNWTELKRMLKWTATKEEKEHNWNSTQHEQN